MAAGEVLLNGTILDDGTTNSHATSANCFDANLLTYWTTAPGATTGYVGVDAGSACSITRARISPLPGYEDATLGAVIQGGSSSTFPAALGFQQGAGGFINATNQASVTKVFANAQAAGNCNIVFIAASASAVISGVTDTSGNSYVLAYGPAGGTRISCYITTGILAATAGSNTVTVSFSTNCDFPTLAIAEYSGISGTGAAAVDAHNSNSGTSTAPSSGSITTTNANDVIISFMSGGDAPTITQGNGFIMNVNLSPSWDMAMEETPVTATGTFTGTFNLSSSQSWSCTVAALKLTGVYDPNAFAFVTSRPVSGPLLNEYLISAAPAFRYFRYAAPAASNGQLSDIDFIVQYAPGVTAAAVAPAVTPPGGQFDKPIVVRLASITTDASIYYTTDGSTPTTSSALYTGPFVISATFTLKAIAVSSGLSNSRVTSSIFTVPSTVISTQLVTDDRNYRVSNNNPFFFKDPSSGYWYMFITPEDGPGVISNGYQGINIYRGSDLRNWTFRGNVMGPVAGAAVGNSVYQSRASIYFNSSTSKYVCWLTCGAGAKVYTATNIEGPWTLFNTYANLNGVSSTADFCIFLDSDGVTAYYAGSAGSNGVNTLISRLNANWTGVDGTNFVVYPTSSTFGVAGMDGIHMFKRGSTYFLLCNTQNQWAPTANLYSTASDPLGTWTQGGNPFQVSADSNSLGLAGAQYGVTVANSYTIAYDSQNSYVLSIPGRGDCFIYTGDRFDTGLSNITGTSTTANFQSQRVLMLPIAFPTSTSLSISWNNAWTLDGVFPTVSGAPVAPAGLVVSGNIATWTNREPNPVNLYLDSADDIAFTQNVVSEVISGGSSNFAITIPGANYRVRAVNASGTSFSTTAPRSAVSGNIPASFPWIKKLTLQSAYSFADASVAQPASGSTLTPGVPFNVPDYQIVSSLGSFTPSPGRGLVSCSGAGVIQYNINGAWTTVKALAAGDAFYVMTDGSNVRWQNPTNGSLTFIFYRELPFHYPSYK